MATPFPTGAVDPATVPTRTLASGAVMPAVGLGTFGSDHVTGEQVAAAVLDVAALGYRHFDRASVCGRPARTGKTCGTWTGRSRRNLQRLAGGLNGERNRDIAMLKHCLTHPQITAALARAGHGSRVLISDGNYPHSTARGPNAEVVYLNLAPDQLGVCDVLRVLATAIPVEHAAVMAANKTGPYAMTTDPDIWAAFSELLKETACRGQLEPIERFAFYDAARSPDVCLTIATGEQRIYANLLLTIGVVQ